MEKKVVSIVSALVLMITVLSSFLLMYFPNMHAMAVNKQTEYEMARAKNKSVMSYLGKRDSSSQTKWAYDASVRFQLPEGTDANAIEYLVKPLDKTVEVRIPGLDEEYFSKYPFQGDNKNLEDVTYNQQDGYGVVDFTFNSIKEYQAKVDGQYLYLGFVKPRDKYDHIVVIDAGHGGNVPGATRAFVMEKDVDLSIAKYLYDELSQVEGLGVYMTRMDDSNPSFAERVGLANALNADLFISIHNNAMTSTVNNRVYGSEVLYKSQDNIEDLGFMAAFDWDKQVALGQAGGEDCATIDVDNVDGARVVARSRDIAEKVLSGVASSFETKAIGVKTGDDLYLIRYSAVPTILVEVGFLTHTEELAKLDNPIYQKKAASGISKAIIESIYNQ